MTNLPKTELSIANGLEAATFGAGCFWCTEAIFQQLKGVEKVQSGFSGGHVEKPSYKQVVEGTTGHAEVVHLQFDPTIITFEELVQVFFTTHDPTTLNRQGADIGPQYRSAIFYHNPSQKEISERVSKGLEKDKVFDSPIVTELTEFVNFYPAEDYHSNYFDLNGHQPYCQFVIRPKVQKFRKDYLDKLKKE
ncbi:peptide-methionine (S)-S-oxide reductase MsrA [Pleomorphovibrio marinus]|uniref:peptide-methionine (S)-S-oxide reductase MsrA n=1 Tax=Pleomorphovibrio marinus TaxID=2164132 RepID=UPI000E0A4FE2|nr:peptide-methionine (S)-S-oxide reductase MsrA [Pleomorphovibrio marinus]